MIIRHSHASIAELAPPPGTWHCSPHSSRKHDAATPLNIALPSPHLLPTFALPTPYLRRFMFGFR